MLTSLPVAAERAADGVEFADAGPDGIVLGAVACWHLLGQEQFGRIAISADGDDEVYPVTYLSRHGRVYFRSAPGIKILELAEHPRVTLEVDGVTMMDRWSAVVRGTARRLGSVPEILRSAVATPMSWQHGEKFNCFEIQPEQITGRLVPTRP
jgi:hypothetical protein